jgi:exodeoxyribonuclease V beta subunit
MSELEFNFSSAKAMDNTQRLAEVIRRHWNGDASKDDFLLAIGNWNRQLPKGFMNGFVDLLFLHDGYYYIIDWKSNILGGELASFTEDGVRKEMAKHGYFFQYLLYAAVLQRFLKEIPGSKYDWERNFGGIRYYFLRGIEVGVEASIFADRPSEKMLDEIGEVLGLEVK